MLFLVHWEHIDTTEEAERRRLAVFSAWKRPEGVEFKAFYGFAEGNGGAAIAEADSAAALARSMRPFVPWLQFTTHVIMPIEEFASVGAEAVAFRDSVA